MKRVFCLLVASLALLMLPTCSSDAGGGRPKAARTWYYEREFREDRSLRAEPPHTVLLDVQRSEGADGAARHSIPYRYPEGGQYTYCIDADDPFLTRMSLEDGAGEAVLSVERGVGCVSQRLEAGNYTMLVEHDGGTAPTAGTVAFVRQIGGKSASGTASPGRENRATSSLFPEWPAFVGLQVVGTPLAGMYLVRSHYQFHSAFASGDTALQVSQLESTTAANFRAYDHLFSFESVSSVAGVSRGDGDPNLTGPYHFHSYLEDKAKLPFSWAPAESGDPDDRVLCIASQNPIGAACFMPAYAGHGEAELTASVEDNGNGTFAIWEEASYVSPLSSIYADPTNQMIYLTALAKQTTSPTLFQADPRFRFYDDPNKVVPLPLPQPGEVALYEGANYTGNAYFINGSFPDSSNVALPTIGSIRLGSDATLQFFSETSFEGTPIVTIGSDQDSLATPFDGATIQSIKVLDSKAVLLSSKACEYCNLAAVDLHSLDLSKVDLTYAALYGANLSYANLIGANLCEASLNGNEQSGSKAADLTGAYLKNTNLGYANLSGTELADANFYSESGAACVPTNCVISSSCASAYGATMTAADFSGAYLSGLDMSAAKAMGAKFPNAMVVGVRFNDSDIGLDPNTGAPTNFDGAFIGGAIFTGAQAGGASFSSAYVDSSQYGSCMLFKLWGTHTEFAGYWNNPGGTPCVMFAYSNATATPTTDNSNTCPDGSSGPCGESQWANPKTPMNNDNPQQPASGCFDQFPVCDLSQVDPMW